jgi:hypothetical protein
MILVTILDMVQVAQGTEEESNYSSFKVKFFFNSCFSLLPCSILLYVEFIYIYIYLFIYYFK